MWSIHRSVFYFDDDEQKGRVKLALFDLDGTLVFTPSGRKLPNPDDIYYFCYSDIFDKLIKYHDDGFAVAILSNQKGLKNVDRLEKVRQDIVSRTHFSPIILASTANDEFRKPREGMFFFVLQLLNITPTDVSPDSFYCGDAAGHDKSKRHPYFEWSDSDYRFSMSVGLIFFNPREIFTIFPLTFRKYQELIIFVGMPASGKSRMARLYRQFSYETVCQDELKTREKVLTKMIEFLDEGKSVIIDRTNPTKEERTIFSSEAKIRGIPIRIFLFLRDGSSVNDQRGDTKVPRIAFQVYAKKFQSPTPDEGTIILVS